MIQKRYLILAFVLFSYVSILAQVDMAWVERYDGGSGTSYDQVRGLAMDDSGNIFVCGFVTKLGHFIDYVTIKYSPEGKVLWEKSYSGDGLSLDIPSALVVDDAGNVYVTGASALVDQRMMECVTIKYSSKGKSDWIKRFKQPKQEFGMAWGVKLDQKGQVYVAYTSETEKKKHNTIIKYRPTGDTAWVRSYIGSERGEDSIGALGVDDSGNVYLTSSSWNGKSNDFLTVKFAPNGDTLWSRSYDGPGMQRDAPSDLRLDDKGNVYVAGQSWGFKSSDYLIIKYASNGDTLWSRRFDGTGNAKDVARAIAIDDSGNVYVTGESWSNKTNNDFCTLKYAPNGDTLWTRYFNGLGNGPDSSFALALDDSGYVYVTGCSWTGTSLDYVILRYSPSGDQLWVKYYNGPTNGIDSPRAIVVDKKRNVYVTGNSNGNGGVFDYDFATIKLAPK